MFSARSYQKELLDNDNIPFDDIKQNMKELDFINKYLGGHSITIDGFKKLAGTKKQISVCEIGCGGGDNLLAIEAYCQNNNIEVELIGIDIKAECIAFAKSRNKFKTSPAWITSDYQKAPLPTKPDIVFPSLFCHHFTEPELLEQLKWMKENASIGFFINDLQRHVLAYYSIKTLTKLFSSSYLVKNDAPLSVLRGFKKEELASVCNKAGISKIDINWKWAFRYLLVYKHGT